MGETFFQKSFPQGFTLAIDGRAASGKTTLAAELSAAFCASVVHMDDFFLPPEMRTEERLSTPGGNIHHERFAAEILPYIKGSDAFSYKIFDCAACEFTSVREVPAAKIRIVEGAYSCHPIFGDYADLRIFSDISPKAQLARIEKRNGKAAMQAFVEKWIPLEEKYLEFFDIKQRADLVL